jgi:hypothetical protein
VKLTKRRGLSKEIIRFLHRDGAQSGFVTKKMRGVGIPGCGDRVKEFPQMPVLPESTAMAKHSEHPGFPIPEKNRPEH